MSCFYHSVSFVKVTYSNFASISVNIEDWVVQSITIAVPILWLAKVILKSLLIILATVIAAIFQDWIQWINASKSSLNRRIIPG